MTAQQKSAAITIFAPLPPSLYLSKSSHLRVTTHALGLSPPSFHGCAAQRDGPAWFRPGWSLVSLLTPSCDPCEMGEFGRAHIMRPQPYALTALVHFVHNV